MRSLAFFRSKLKAAQKMWFFPEQAKKSELTALENQQLPDPEAQAPCSCTVNLAIRPPYDCEVPASLPSDPLTCGAAHQRPEAEHPCRTEDPVWCTWKYSRKGDRQHCQAASVLITILYLLVLFLTCIIIYHWSLRYFHVVEFSCPQGWREYKDSCYFFSNTKASWIFSLNNCSLFGGSLLVFDSLEEMDYIIKTQTHSYIWIGLQREDVGQPWHRTNDSVFGDSFPIRGYGRCAYLNEDEVSSTWCNNRRYWICRKP